MPQETEGQARKRYNRSYYLKRKAKRAKTTPIDERKIPWHGRLPETLLGRIQRVTNEGIATGRFPWKTTGECIVNLIQRGFMSLKDDEFIGEFIPHIEMTQHLDRIHTQRREAQSILAKARQEVQELLGIGAVDGAVSYYHVTMDAARKMPPTEWRDWLIKELKKAFPDLAKQQPRGVPLFGHKKSKRRR